MFTCLRYLFVFFVLTIATEQCFAQGGDDEIYDDEIADTVKVDNKKKGPRVKKNPGEAKKLQMTGLFFGSGVGFDIWQNLLRFDLSPHVGYRIGDIFAPAIGMTYIFFTEIGARGNGLSTNVIGPKALLRIRPIKNIPTLNQFYLHVEAEYLTFTQKSSGGISKANQTRVNAGVGYTTNFAKGFGFTTEILLDVYYLSLKTRQTYLNPITYRIGFTYGF
jgi:hypothetical protein